MEHLVKILLINNVQKSYSQDTIISNKLQNFYQLLQITQQPEYLNT